MGLNGVGLTKQLVVLSGDINGPLKIAFEIKLDLLPCSIYLTHFVIQCPLLTHGENETS